MSFLTRNLNQKITHWAKGSTQDAFANPTWIAPVILNGRWQDATELTLDLDGNEILVKSIVFLDTDVEEGDYLMNREFISGEIDPIQISDAFQVKKFGKNPDLKAVNFERVAFLD